MIEKVSEECACLFQRSSSCVEGHNGQLSLHHHSLHRLSSRKLAALTTVHNYFIKCSDGTTSVERFFVQNQEKYLSFFLGKMTCREGRQKKVSTTTEMATPGYGLAGGRNDDHGRFFP